MARSLQDGHLLDRHYVSFLERDVCIIESTKRCKERQRPTPGVCFSEVSIKKELTVILLVILVICSTRTHPFFCLSVSHSSCLLS